MLVCVITSLIAAVILGVLPFLFTGEDDRPVAVRMVESAKRAGRTAEAELQIVHSQEDLSVCMATYSYTVDGTLYSYRYAFPGNDPPRRLTVYYPEGRPGDAFLERPVSRRSRALPWYRLAAPPLIFLLSYCILSFLLS